MGSAGPEPGERGEGGPGDHDRQGARPVRVRRPRFRYPDDVDPCWTPVRPEFACAANAISLLMPHLEPYVVRAVAAGITDLEADPTERPGRVPVPPGVIARARGYVGQESQHHHEHRRFNRFLLARYPGLSPVDRWAAALFRWLDRRAGSRFGVAFAATSETIAYSAARWCDGRRRDLLDGSDPALAGLFLWHLAEEVEHKAAAFEIQLATGIGRRHRLAAMAVSLAVVLWFVVAGTTVMLWSERRLAHPVAWFRLVSWAVTFAFELIPNLVLSLLPGFHPDQLTDPLWYEVWLRQLDHDDHQHGCTDPATTWAYHPLHG